ncbi:nicotinate (nicotinamide) nucleotide adenylyltransferase [Hydrogenophaga sp. R2]|uniref:nicotinate (nicotinamide) nucleotide adenylyltransferase n=1 Tax=Hydrogenophaga sp. R2 TaxID=3132827 RepID=UPI003CEBA270
MSDSGDGVIRRVGMFGGAFDPPHGAHRSLAEVAIEQLGLDVLHVLPTGQAWHKARPLTDASHRVAMCQLAFGDLPRARIDDREIHRQGPSYTADTLAELRREYPLAELYLVLGADQLLAFRSWVRWQDVMSLARLAVAARARSIGAQALDQPAEEADLSGVDLPFVPLTMPLNPVSATAVRARLAAVGPDAAALDLLVPAPVASYISQNHLYQTPT